MADMIDFGAMCISAAAALVAIRTLKADAVDRRIAVKPFISFYREAKAVDQSVCLRMKSTGLGPAIISELVLLFDSRPIRVQDQNDIRPIADELQVTLETPHFLGEISPGTVFAVDDTIDVVKFTARTPFDEPVDVRAIARRFDVIVKYRSVYSDQLFESKSEDSRY